MRFLATCRSIQNPRRLHVYFSTLTNAWNFILWLNGNYISRIDTKTPNFFEHANNPVSTKLVVVCTKIVCVYQQCSKLGEWLLFLILEYNYWNSKPSALIVNSEELRNEKLGLTQIIKYKCNGINSIRTWCWR